MNLCNQNNLSETAFFTPIDSTYQIRWFTCEVVRLNANI
ncbi:hypothetical protein BROOK1789C_1563 [Bathymodiolus brooksi thiotrophic gill symbiont]|nr:hypothetical protein BROOK1789C_1563 [Bathymodiolus brooksi thiotrophic gill symbiont]